MMNGIRQYLHEILYLMGPNKKKIPYFAFLFSVASLLDLAGLGLIGPYTALAVDLPVGSAGLERLEAWIGSGGDRKQIMIVLGMVLLCIFSIKAFAGVMISRANIRFSQQQGERLGQYLMGKYQGMTYVEFLNRSSNEYIQTISSLCTVYANMIMTSLKTLGDLIVCSAILLLLAWQDIFALSLLAALLGLALFGYDWFFRRRLKRYGEEYNKSTLKIYQGVRESMEGFKEIRILGRESHFFELVKEGMQTGYKYAGKMQLISTAPRFLLELILIGFVVLLVIGTLASGKNLALVLPTLSMFGVASLRLLPSMNILSQSLVNIRYFRDSISRLYHDYRMAQAFEGSSGSQIEAVVPARFESLALEGVGFTYPSASVPSLNDIHLRIAKGESIGLMGHSGSGKTTLVDVLLGLLEPQEGRILFNGAPVKDSLASWRGLVAYLPQNIFLIDDTLANNIALGETRIDEDRLREALKQARLEELVNQLPQGKDTLLGEHGIRLSGGQRQRVALARAFYHGRSVLIMDEATSALDQETEREIVEEIQRLKGMKTMIVIAHRLTTLRHCHHIYELHNGCLVRSGTYEEVVQRTLVPQ